MKVLILSCNTGEGHNSCAKALAESFTKQGITCDIADSLAFISPAMSKLLSKSHVFIYRYLPTLFNWGYHFSEKYDFLYRKGAPVYIFLSLGSKRLAQYINEGGYDVVICAHVFAGVTMTEAERFCTKKPLTAFLTTDYTCSPITEQSDLDMYFIPDDGVQPAFIARGVDANKLVSVGIPIRQSFYTQISKEDAKNVEGIDTSHKHLVVMCGSMGCGPIRKIVNRISGQLDEDMEMTVICGNNKKLYQQLSALQDADSKIHVRGYVDNISRLMDSADVYLTKPGGISVTEASVKKIPMVLVNAVGGCEEYNYNFFTDIGAAVSGNSLNEIIQECLQLMNQPDMQTRMCNACEEAISCNAADSIAEHLVNAYKTTYQHLAVKLEIDENTNKIEKEGFAL